MMNRERVTPDDVFTAMRMAGVDQLAQVRWAILEADGRIAIVPERSLQQARTQDVALSS